MTGFRHFDILPKTRSRVTTATTFSRQNDAASSASTTWYWENLVLVVELVLEKALYFYKKKTNKNFQVSFIHKNHLRPFLSAHYLIYEIFCLNLTFTIYRKRDSKSLYYFAFFRQAKAKESSAWSARYARRWSTRFTHISRLPLPNHLPSQA